MKHRRTNKKNCNRGTALKRSVENHIRVGGSRTVLNQFYSRETSPLILIQLQITNVCSVCIGVD